MKACAVAIAGLLLCVPLAYAQCWRVGNFEGTGASAAEKYRLTQDGMRQPLEVRIEGRKASVSGGYSDFACLPLGPSMVSCFYEDGRQGVSATFAIDPALNRVLHTQIRSGFGSLDGGRLFVGRILGSCGPSH